MGKHSAGEQPPEQSFVQLHRTELLLGTVGILASIGAVAAANLRKHNQPEKYRALNEATETPGPNDNS